MTRKKNTPPSSSAGRNKKVTKKPAAKTPTETVKKQPAKQAAKPAVKTKSAPNSEQESTKLLAQIVALLSELLKKKKRANSNVRNEFRWNLDTDHPNYVFEVDDEKEEYHAVGLTSEPTTFGDPNMPLKSNGKKGKEKKSYARNGIVEDSKRSFAKKPMKNMKFSQEDMPNVKSKIRNYKKERKKGQKNKETSHSD